MSDFPGIFLKTFPKAAWNEAKLLMGKTSTTESTNVIIYGTCTSNPQKMANGFGKHHKEKLQYLRQRSNQEYNVHPTE